jgi:recombination protein RecR
MNFSSRYLEEAVKEFAQLPGIGSKTALRLVLHLLKQDKETIERFGKTFLELKDQVQYCRTCNNISDQEVCEICRSPKRNREEICIVEDIRDILAIENTQQFNGLYHVLGGLISPMEGIGPSDLNVESIVERARAGEVKELIMALSATMEGDTTIFYLYKKLKDFDLKITTIARGVSFGGELEYVDELTLGRSIVTRIPYENTLSR